VCVFFFFDIFCFSFFWAGLGVVWDWLTVGTRSTPGQVWLTAEATAEKGGWTSVSPGGTHTSPNGDGPRVECGFHGQYRFVGNSKFIGFYPSTFYPWGWVFFYFVFFFTFVLLSLSPLLFAFLSLAHRRRPCAHTALETYPLLSPALSSGAPCFLRVRLLVPSQALFSIPHSSSPKGFKLFFIWCPFEHSIAAFRVPCSSLSLERFSWLQAQVFWCWCALASEGNFLELVSFRFVFLPA